MASSRPRRDVCVSSPSQSEVEDAGSDSDFSPGSLIIDMGSDGTVYTHSLKNIQSSIYR